MILCIAEAYLYIVEAWHTHFFKAEYSQKHVQGVYDPLCKARILLYAIIISLSMTKCSTLEGLQTNLSPPLTDVSGGRAYRINTITTIDTMKANRCLLVKEFGGIAIAAVCASH